MFEMKGTGGLGNIGERNIIKVKSILKAEGLRITGEDTGSNYARTMLLVYRPVRYRYEQRAVRRNISKEERENGRYRDIIGIRDK